MSITAQTALQWSEQGYVPDRIIRLGIQRLLAERLIEIQHNDCEAMADGRGPGKSNGLSKSSRSVISGERGNRTRSWVSVTPTMNERPSSPSLFARESSATCRKDGASTLVNGSAASVAYEKNRVLRSKP